MRPTFTLVFLLLNGSLLAQGCPLVVDLNPGNGGKDGSSPQGLTCAFGDSLLFYARTAPTRGLYRAAPNGTVQMLKGNAVVEQLTPCSTPQGARVFFTLVETATGSEPWVTDGTAAGTKIVKDIRPGGTTSSPTNLTPFGDRLLFAANDGKTGRELYISDGTAAGTTRVRDIRPGSGSSNPANIVACGEFAVFSADDGSSGIEPWVTDGTASGTRLLKDIGGTNYHSLPRNVTRVGNQAVFVAYEPSSGRELWATNGTPGGTRRLADIYPGTTASNPDELSVLGGRVFFTATDGSHGSEIWVSDLTTAGTKLAIDVLTGTRNSYPSYLTVCNGKLYFAAGTSYSQLRAHVSDGTQAGTKEIRYGTGVQDYLLAPRDFVASGGRVFFAATGASVGGQGLWVTDDTIAGTVQCKNSSATPTHPADIVATGNGVCCRATTTSGGFEPWFSDGTAAGTKPICDLQPGTTGSTPEELTLAGGRLFFVATTTTRGRELFWIPKPGASAVAIPGASPRDLPACEIEGARSPVLGSSIKLVGRGPAGHHGFLVLGLPAPSPLPGIPGLLQGGSDWIGLSSVYVVLASASARTVTLPVTIPNVPALDGAAANVQSWWLRLTGPLGFQVSNGLRLTVGAGLAQ